MASEYGSSPVLAALHQMRSGRAARARRSSTRAWKVVLLAEERGQVGGQAVDELLPLALGRAALFQPLQVGREAAVAGLAQAPRQAAVDHGLLAGVQADAGALVDQRADALEVGRRQRELRDR
jgi:hypothetical protein